MEREREAAIKAAARAADEERRARSAARRRRLGQWVPRQRGRTGTLADRRRTELTVLFLLLFTLNLMIWLAGFGWGVRALALIVSVLGAPVVFLMLFRRS